MIWLSNCRSLIWQIQYWLPMIFKYNDITAGYITTSATIELRYWLFNYIQAAVIRCNTRFSRMCMVRKVSACSNIKSRDRICYFANIYDTSKFKIPGLNSKVFLLKNFQPCCFLLSISFILHGKLATVLNLETAIVEVQWLNGSLPF